MIRKSVNNMIIVCLALLLLVTPISAEGSVDTVVHCDTKAYNWYFKKNDAHLTPDLPNEFSFIRNYGAYYCNENVKKDDKVIYLTFDAGYENGNVEKILDIMKRYDAKGAFFVLGNLIKRNTELVKRMVDEGHLVCNHTNRHHDMTKTTDHAKFSAELNDLNGIMKEYCGVDLAPFYRPPEGRFSESNLRDAKDCGYSTVFWSYAYADWDNNNQMKTEQALRKVLLHTHNGEILLLHPTSATNAAILDTLLATWTSQGYRFGSLYELTR